VVLYATVVLAGAGHGFADIGDLHVEHTIQIIGHEVTRVDLDDDVLFMVVPKIECSSVPVWNYVFRSTLLTSIIMILVRHNHHLTACFGLCCHRCFVFADRGVELFPQCWPTESYVLGGEIPVP